MSTVAAPPRAGIGSERRTLVVASICTLVVVAFVASINLAVPLLAASPLRPGSSGILWIVDSYVVVFACLVIPGGAVGDRVGRKGAVMLGLALVAAGALVCGFAPDLVVMLGGRILSGVGAALVLPNCVGMLVHATEEGRRRRALAIWGSISGMGGIIGNTGGAALLGTGIWQVLFWGVAAIAVATIVAVAILTSRSARTPRRLDPVGTLLLVGTTVALLLGIIGGPESGWTHPLVLGAFAAAVLLGAAWVIVELRVAHPLLDQRVFRSPLLSGAALGMLVTWFGSFGLFFLNASLLQYGRGFPVLEAGLATLPLAIPILVGSRFVPALVARIGIPVALGAGFVLISAGLAGLSSAVNAPFVVYALWLVVVGAGFALALPTLTAELTAGLPPEKAGVAGGLQSATRDLGSALGIAVVGTVAASVFVQGLPPSLARLPRPPHTVADALAVAPDARASIVSAYVAGGATALLVGAIVTLASGAAVVLVSLRGRAPAGG